MKFLFPKPQCNGQECFVDLRGADKGQRVHNRSLMPGERYCVHGKKVRRFKKQDAQYRVPRWCPRLHRGTVTRVFTRAPNNTLDLLYGQLGREMGMAPVLLHRYVLRVVSSTGRTPVQFAKWLKSGHGDYWDELGYYPKQHDVVEIGNGITAAYLYLNKQNAWQQIHYFDATKCDYGGIGGYVVKPYEGYMLDRFSHSTEEYGHDCIGYVRGYFADGRFQSHWQDNRPELSGPELHNEVEALIDTLKTNGFLREPLKLADYCLRFSHGMLPDAFGEYGYTVETEAHSFYIRCLPNAESYQFYLYVYKK